jgi:hypothetical protein
MNVIWVGYFRAMWAEVIRLKPASATSYAVDIGLVPGYGFRAVFKFGVWRNLVGLLEQVATGGRRMILHRLALALVCYGSGLFLLYLTDTGEKRRYRGRAGLRRLLLHGLFLLPIVVLVTIYIPAYYGPTP